MEVSVFLAVLAASLMHAGWNAMVRSRLDRFSSVLLLTIVCAVLALGLMPFFALPARAAWPWLAASIVIHTFYMVFLARAYEHGDLSQVYPLARGSAPLAVAIIGVVFLGEAVTATRMAAVAAIGCGVMLMSLRGGANLRAMPHKALFYVLGTAASIAAYTLSDGLGARASENASGYTMWLFFLNGLTLSAYALIERGPRVFAKIAPQWRNGLATGVLSLGSYWIALWAFTKAAIPLVAALRETSVLFAMLIGIVFLGEKAGRWRWVAALLIVAGTVGMRM